MRKTTLVLGLASVMVLVACGGSGGNSAHASGQVMPGRLPGLNCTSPITAPVGVVSDYALLGNVIAHGEICYYSGDDSWHEFTSTWRVGKTVNMVGQRVKLTAFVHIRSGTGGCHPKLYNKLRIVRVAPTYDANIMVDSEALIESTGGCHRFFDASRTITILDQNPVAGAVNVYAIETIAGEGVHTEISYGSSFLAEVI